MRALAAFASVGRLHIVAIAALGTFTFGWIFTGRYSPALAALAGMDWFLVNLLNRVVDLPEDRANGIAGTDFVARHRRTILAGGIALLGASLLATAPGAPLVTALRVTFHALGLAYNFPLLPGGRRIKQLYFWKNTASATGFMLTVFAFPLCAPGAAGLQPGITPATIAVTGCFFFLFELSYEVIYDLRDVAGDALAQVRSYPVVHGVAGGARVVDGLLGASVLALGAGYATGVVPWRIFIMVCAPVVQFVVYRRALRRGISSADCVGITWFGAALLAGYHAWVAAGLPGTGA